MYLESNIGEIRLLFQKNSVKSLYVFGSVLTDRLLTKVIWILVLIFIPLTL